MYQTYKPVTQFSITLCTLGGDLERVWTSVRAKWAQPINDSLTNTY